MLIVFGPSTLLLWAMIYLVHSEYSWMQDQVDTKQLQLTAFNKQYELGQKRLAALKSDKGNEEILIEHGYIPPGDRILLFPATGEEQRAAAIPKNDLAPHEPSTGAPSPGAGMASGWSSAGSVLHSWWQTLRSGAGVKPATPSNPSQPLKSVGAATPSGASTSPNPEQANNGAASAVTPQGAAASSTGTESREVTSIHAKPTASGDPATSSENTASADIHDGAGTSGGAESIAPRPGTGSPAGEESLSHSGSHAHSGSARHSLSVEAD